MSDVISRRQPDKKVYLHPSAIGRKHGFDLTIFKCQLPLWLDDGSGGLSPEIPFVVDSGADITSVGVDFAAAAGIPLPLDDSPEFELRSTTASGQEMLRVRPGRIRAWWTLNQQGDPFDWPILFNVFPPNRRSQKALLGLGGVITTCSWKIVGPQPPDWYKGYTLFTDVRPLQPRADPAAPI